MMTCINADAQDIQSQVRLTIRPLNNNDQFGPMGLGFGHAGLQFNRDAPQDWTVDGMLLSSQMVQKVSEASI